MPASLGFPYLHGDGAWASFGADAQRDHQAKLLHWRERWQRSGPFALVSELCAEQATRLLGLLDGVKGEVTVVAPAWAASGLSARAAYAQAAERVMDALVEKYLRVWQVQRIHQEPQRKLLTGLGPGGSFPRR